MWVDSKIKKLTYQGSIAEWSKVADVSEHPRPRMVMPLGVELDKLILIYDARWLNLMWKYVPFAMNLQGKVAQCSWEGAHQVTLDHKSGFHHVDLDPESWQLLERCVLRIYGTALRVVHLPVHLPHFVEYSEPVPEGQRHPGPGMD